MRRVLWVVKGLGPGGAERLLVAAARAHDRSAVELHCAYVLPWKDHLAGELEAAGVRTHCLSARRRDLAWPLHLAALVRAGDFDVVHVHSPLPGSVARLAVRTMRRDRRPGLVSTEHNRWATHRWPTRLLNHVTARWDDATFAVTDEVRSSMRGRARRRAVVLRHGIDTGATAAALADRPSVRNELGLANGDVVVGTVANFRAQKDYPNLLEAARQLHDRHVPVRFVAVGQGPDEAAIRASAAAMGLDDVVTFTGFRADAVRVMAACDVFTLASQWEGLPVAVMEATALGLPIVATAVGGVAEELRDGQDALLVPPGDPASLAAALERVVTDAPERRRLAAASAATAARFDVRRTVDAIEEVYARVAPSRPANVEQSGPAPTVERKRSRPVALDIRPATEQDRPVIVDLLKRSLGADDDPRYPELVAWKHDRNPFGPSPMWVAIDGDRVVAVRALMRWEFVRGGQVLRAVRAVDTATDPEYQGRGLFTSLTLHALREMTADGVAFVFNTPNSQSRPGYLKMGWREVGNLPAAVRFSGASGALTAIRSKVPAARWSMPIDAGEPVDAWIDRGAATRWLGYADHQPVDVRMIRTRADEAYLRWRFGTPLLGYRVVDDDRAAVIVRGRRRGAATELAVVGRYGDEAHADRLAARVARQVGADYAIRLGTPSPARGYAPLPGGGPVLTWRAVNDPGEPPLSNWALTLGDVELF